MIAQEEEPKTEEVSAHKLRDYVSRGAKLAREIAPLEKKKDEWDQIKAILRAAAHDQDAEFKGNSGEIIRVEQKPPTICRTVDESLLPKVLRIVGDSLHTMFSLHPRKGSEKTFELNAHKTLPKKPATQLVDLLTEKATAWVRVIRYAVK